MGCWHSLIEVRTINRARDCKISTVGLVNSVSLGALEGDSVRPVFRGSVDGLPFAVELDSSALIKLTQGHIGDARIAALETQRGRVRAAVQSLYDNGFLNAADPRLVISALDIV